MRLLIVACAALALTACEKPQQEPANESALGAQAGPVKGVNRSNKGQPAPDATFKNPEGDDVSLANFKGRPALVNLWATWCAPCVKELPTLDRLSRSSERGGQIEIVAISQDTAPHASVVAFLETHKLGNLAAYQDPKMALSASLGAEVLPTSILYDSHGREVWRYVGDLDWTGKEAAKLLAEAGAFSAP